MSRKVKRFIYCWEGMFTDHVVDYAYFIVDQLQCNNGLGDWLDKKGGGWLLCHPKASHPALHRLLNSIQHLHPGEIMQLARFVEKYKSKLLATHGMLNPRPVYLHVKCL